MHILTAPQMQQVDADTIATVCPGIELMERAGRGVAKAILSRYGAAASGERPHKVVVFCGAGNNGGDGLVVARLLRAAGWACSVHLLKTTDLTPDTSKNYQRLLQSPDTAPLSILDATRPDWPERAPEDLPGARLVIDAILGTGATGAPRERAADMIALINACRARGIPVVSIDIPSGVDGTSGDVAGAAVRAGWTLTIGNPKTGLLFHPGREHVGELTVLDIGFPADVVARHAGPWSLLDDTLAASLLPPRAPDIHKYDAGVLLAIAGSDRYRGAPLLLAEAALRAGCGMVYLAVPEGIRDGIAPFVREAITVPLPQTATGTIAPHARVILESYIEKADAVAIGPGLDRDDATDAFVRDLVERATQPVVVDADAIVAFAGHAEAIARAAGPRILTPHDGELRRLLGDDVPVTPLERLAFAGDAARRLNATVLLKGSPSLVATPDGRVRVSTTGNAALAKAGTGDVLTGIVGSLAAQHAQPEAAAAVACFVHGRAGDRAARQVGPRGVLAGDLPRLVGQALAALESAARR